MLKPFFNNPFTSLATRTGVPIGHSGERVMLDAVGGSQGFRKRYQTNADGSTTMLQTKNGMPRFITNSVAVAGAIFVTSVFESDENVFGDPPVEMLHTITVPAGGSDYSLWFVDLSATAGIDYDNTPDSADFSDGVTILGATISVPSGITGFTLVVRFTRNSANLAGYPLVYELHIGNGSIEGFGTGTLNPI